MTSDKLISLESVRRQYQQDLIVVFEGHVFKADAMTLFFLEKGNEAFDKDGFPAPILGADNIALLKHRLFEAFNKAKKAYFERMNELGLNRLLEVEDNVDEPTE